MHQQQLTRNKF